MEFGYRHLNLLGAVLLLTALVLIFVYGDRSITPVVMLVASLAILIVLVLQRNQFEEEIMPDERTRMIAARSLSNAWWVGIVGIILLFWADVLGIWRPEALTALGLSALLLIVPVAMYLVYRSSRGEPGT